MNLDGTKAVFFFFNINRAVELEGKLQENIPSATRPKLTRQISHIRPIGEIAVIGIDVS